MEFKEYNEKIQQLVQSILENRMKQMDQVISDASELIAYGKKTQDDKLLGCGHFYMGEAYYDKNNGKKFFSHMSEAMGYLNNVGDWGMIARCNNYLGIESANRNNLHVALEYYLNSLRIGMEHDIQEIQMVSQVNISMLYMSCECYEISQMYLLDAYQKIKNLGVNAENYSLMSAICGNLVKCMAMQDAFDEAEYYLSEAKKYSDVVAGEDTIVRLFSLFVTAIYYHRKGDEEKRDECIETVDDLITDHLPILDIFDDFYDYCRILVQAGRDEEFWHIEKCFEKIALKSKVVRVAQRMFFLKMEFYKKKGQEDKYLIEAGKYCELVKQTEQETREMMNIVLKYHMDYERENQAKIKAEREREMYQKKSELDALTGIANRLRWNEHADELLQRACDEKTGLAVGIMDIDFFKQYNDNYGHQAGDDCIKRVADVLKSVMDECDGFCARYGGDEFVAMIKGVTKEETLEIARKIKEKILEENMEHAYSETSDRVTVSQGICWEIPVQGNRMWDYLHTADLMLYRVKEKKKNNYCLCDLRHTEEEIIMGSK